jgi:hypothetical protein
MQLTHSIKNEPKMTHRRTKKQHGGMKLSHESLQYLIDNGIEYNDFNVMRFLIANTNGVRIVWDASTYSFIFELTFPHGLIDPYGLPLAASAATFDAFDAFTAGAGAEPGTRVSTFCAKISFVNDGPSGNLRKEFKNVRKETVSSYKADREAVTQRMLFEQFACRRTTAPFVPDVIAHAILSGDQFRAIFGPSQTNPGILSSTDASTRPDILGTPKEIYDWIDAWIASDGIMVDVILMEMMDLQRTVPSVPRSQPFQMIYQLRSRASAYLQAALRMMANIASVRGKGILPTDFHEGNGMATHDGLQLYLIDWGGLWNLFIPEDRAKVLHDFAHICARAFTTEQEESANAIAQLTAASSDKDKRLARFPSLEGLCHFFKLNFNKFNASSDRDKIVRELNQKFETDLTGYVDFTCVAPTAPDVHHALMMVAFVDFMSNRMNSNYPFCQCGSVLNVVYPDQAGTVSTTYIRVTAFDDFRTFLKTFEVKQVPSNTRLPDVVAMIKENVQLCSSACAPLSPSDLRPDVWVNEEITRRAEARLESARLEEARLAHEMALAEEARRLAADRLAKEEKAAAKEAKRVAKETEAAIKRLAAARTPRIAKPKTESKRTQASDDAQIKSAVAQAAQAQAQGEPVQDVAVPTSWLSRLNPLSWEPRSWLSRLSRLSRSRQGGTRKQRKQCKQCKSFTKRRHN